MTSQESVFFLTFFVLDLFSEFLNYNSNTIFATPHNLKFLDRDKWIDLVSVQFTFFYVWMLLVIFSLLITALPLVLSVGWADIDIIIFVVFVADYKLIHLVIFFLHVHKKHLKQTQLFGHDRVAALNVKVLHGKGNAAFLVYMFLFNLLNKTRLEQ